MLRIWVWPIAMISFGFASLAHASGDTATYAYDTYGRVQTVTYANGTVITYNYDAAGNRTSVVTNCSANGC